MDDIPTFYPEAVDFQIGNFENYIETLISTNDFQDLPFIKLQLPNAINLTKIIKKQPKKISAT